MRPIIPQKILGDCRASMQSLPERKFHLCVTSPPYWGLRNYGTNPLVWGGDAKCEHEWGGEIPGSNRGGSGTPTDKNGRGEEYARALPKWRFCTKCNAWLGSLGMEPTPDLFIQNLLDVFRGVRRVLRDDGTLWVNLGDSYANDTKWGGHTSGKHVPDLHGDQIGRMKRTTGLKGKDLCMIPQRFAIAMQADGWYLRSQIPWIKRNCMPESCGDRPGTAVEYFFLFSKSEHYFYDRVAVMIKSKDGTAERAEHAWNGRMEIVGGKEYRQQPDPTERLGDRFCSAMRNRRNSDWFFESWQGLMLDDDGRPMALVVNPSGTRIEHFASYPPKLVEPIIKCGTSEYGACAKCGAPWERMIHKSDLGFVDRTFRSPHETGTDGMTNGTGKTTLSKLVETKTFGWQPSCECYGKFVRGKITIPARLSKEAVEQWGATDGEYNGRNQKDYIGGMAQEPSTVKQRIIENATQDREIEGWIYEPSIPIKDHPVVPCEVLDPFSGTSTTGMVATNLGRMSTMLELSPDYFEAAKIRDSQGALL